MPTNHEADQPPSLKNTEKRAKLMVTGASGNLGHWICRMAVNAWSVCGTYLRHPFDMTGVQAVRVDLTDTPALKKVFSTIEPDAVIHAAAITQPGICETDPIGTDPINAGVPPILSQLCAERGIPFLFISSDLVFNGKDAPYDEKQSVTPVCVYGRQKAQAEAAVLERYTGALVCRMPLLFGVGPQRSGNFSIEMLSAIQKGRPVRLFTDEFRTPVDFKSAAKGVLDRVGQCQGILHLGGRTRISRFEMGLLMARQMDIDPTMLVPVTIDAVSLGMTRSPDCTLVSQAAHGMGYDPSPLSAALECFVREVEEMKRSAT